MKINSALHNIKLIGIETAPFIYFVEKNPNYIDRVRTIFQRVNQGTLQAITSVITLTEVLIMPLRTRHMQYEREYRDMILNTAHITPLSVNPAIAEKAAHLRATYNLRTPDALHIATAIVAKCDVFLTNDLALKRVAEIQVLVLDELEL